MRFVRSRVLPFGLKEEPPTPKLCRIVKGCYMVSVNFTGRYSPVANFANRGGLTTGYSAMYRNPYSAADFLQSGFSSYGAPSKAANLNYSPGIMRALRRTYGPELNMLLHAYGRLDAALMARSQANLVGVHDGLKDLYPYMVERCPDGLFPCVVEGLRGKERQAELRRSGLSWTNQSKHLTGEAIDVV